MTRPRIVPHRTRVDVPGRGPGMVIALTNGRRRPHGFGVLLDLPAEVLVVLDTGGRARARVDDVTVLPS